MGENIDYQGALESALRWQGTSARNARKFVQGFHDEVASRTLANSDHEAYRILADVINEVIHREADSDDWDGDDSELDIVCKFVEWLPDMIRHNEAEKIRAAAQGDPVTGYCPAVSTAKGAAGLVDPFEQTSGGQWVRKSDKEPVPWPVVKD